MKRITQLSIIIALNTMMLLINSKQHDQRVYSTGTSGGHNGQLFLVDCDGDKETPGAPAPAPPKNSPRPAPAAVLTFEKAKGQED
jgi:hypothetical protein